MGHSYQVPKKMVESDNVGAVVEYDDDDVEVTRIDQVEVEARMEVEAQVWIEEVEVEARMDEARTVEVQTEEVQTEEVRTEEVRWGTGYLGSPHEGEPCTA